jgi:hypothetical protein
MSEGARISGTLPASPGIAGGFLGARMTWSDKLMDGLFRKASSHLNEIHGKKWQCHLWEFENMLTSKEKRFVDSLKNAGREHGVQQYPPMRNWGLLDFAVLRGPAGTKCQTWHMDTRDNIVVLTILAKGTSIPTELADVQYVSIDVEDEEIQGVADLMELPWDWSSLTAATRTHEWFSNKTALMFFGNAVHRGPGVPAGGPDRDIIYLSWGPVHASTYHFISEKFFNSLRVNTHTH